jgi:hypothetical protein
VLFRDERGGDALIRYLLALLGLAALVRYFRERYGEGSTSSLQDADASPRVRGWLEKGQGLSFALLGLGLLAAVVAVLGRIGPLFEAGMLAVIAAGGLWGVCEAAKGFRPLDRQ